MAKLTVVLLGNDLVTQNEDDQAAEVITPGHLLEYDGSGDLIKHSDDGAYAPVMVALEREELGTDMNENYAIGDTVKAGVAPAGVRLNVIIASGVSVSKGDILASAGDGTFEAVGSGVGLVQAIEDKNNSAGPTTARLRVQVI